MMSVQYMSTLKSVSMIALPDIEVIFLKIPNLHQTYYKFVHGLEPLLKKWTPEQTVAPLIKEFVSVVTILWCFGTRLRSDCCCTSMVGFVKCNLNGCNALIVKKLLISRCDAHATQSLRTS